MATDYRYRLYATLKRTPDLLEQYNRLNLLKLSHLTRQLLVGRPNISAGLLKELQVVSAPSLDWQPAFVGDEDFATVIPDELILAYGFQTADAAQSFVDFVVANRGVALDENGNMFLEVGSDPGGAAADHWCPSTAQGAMFGHRRDSRRTIGADALTTHIPKLSGKRVNVVVIDQGLDQAAIPTANWGGGFGTGIFGTASRTSHGMATARSILDLAPDAVLYDAPIIPERITNIPVFTSVAQALYATLIQKIGIKRTQTQWSGPWVLVNAWAIFDRATDFSPFGSYTENKANGGHPLINLVTMAVQDCNLDVIFGAGNCGQFCPSRRCTPLDRGPGHSIWGANAHPLVITTGAVRSDETWLGYSSQGPGPAALAAQKPDFCAPSQFCEDNDAAVVNSGTSASCAVTAGAVAALRSNLGWDQFTVPPGILKGALITTARKTHGPAWSDRLGFGILDLKLAIGQLSKSFPTKKGKFKKTGVTAGPLKRRSKA